MPLFMIERSYAEQLEVTPEAASLVKEINAEENVRWLYSFLSADRRKTYCIYESADPRALRAAALRAGLPADVIIELAARLEPSGELTPV